MSLVDYASSSDDDISEAEEERKEDQPQVPKHEPSPPTLAHNNPISGLSSTQQPESSVLLSSPSIEKLPDASLLFNSPTVPLVIGYDHVSRVAAAMAESASRKRDSNGQSSSSLPRHKVPRGTLPQTKNVPDTVCGVLVPPQLTGRSNVVTEDIGKLFVKRHADPHVRGSPN